jgi:hypothetical protein
MKFVLLHTLQNVFFNFECVKMLCNVDESIVREKCTPSDTSKRYSGQLPSYFLSPQPHIPIISDKGDFFHLLRKLYPAAADIKDDHSKSLYDKAVVCNMRVYFIRLLLRADPKIDPLKRCDLNYEGRKRGIF